MVEACLLVASQVLVLDQGIEILARGLLPVLSELPGMLDFLALTVGTLASTPDPAPSADVP